MKYIVAINASPRTGWNTSKLVEEAEPFTNVLFFSI